MVWNLVCLCACVCCLLSMVCVFSCLFSIFLTFNYYSIECTEDSSKMKYMQELADSLPQQNRAVLELLLCLLCKVRIRLLTHIAHLNIWLNSSHTPLCLSHFFKFCFLYGYMSIPIQIHLHFMFTHQTLPFRLRQARRHKWTALDWRQCLRVFAIVRNLYTIKNLSRCHCASPSNGDPE